MVLHTSMLHFMLGCMVPHKICYFLCSDVWCIYIQACYLLCFDVWYCIQACYFYALMCGTVYMLVTFSNFGLKVIDIDLPILMPRLHCMMARWLTISCETEYGGHLPAVHYSNAMIGQSSTIPQT